MAVDFDRRSFLKLGLAGAGMLTLGGAAGMDAESNPIPHEGVFTMVSGPSGSGRTTVIARMVVDAVREGREVRILDKEMAPSEWNHRLLTAGMDCAGVSVGQPLFLEEALRSARLGLLGFRDIGGGCLVQSERLLVVLNLGGLDAAKPHYDHPVASRAMCVANTVPYMRALARKHGTRIIVDVGGERSSSALKFASDVRVQTEGVDADGRVRVTMVSRSKTPHWSGRI